MNEWSNRKIKNNKNFKELVTHDGVSLWWFADRWLRENDRSSTKMVSASQIINYLNDSTSKIENKTDNEIKDELSEKFLKDINIKKIKCGLIYVLFNLKQSFRHYYLKIFKRSSVIKKIEKDKKRILIIAGVRGYIKKIDLVTKKEVKRDEYFDGIMKELEMRNYAVKAIDVDIKPNIRMDVLREKKEPLWGFYEQYTSKDIDSIVKNQKKHIKNLWEELKKDKDFINSFDYKVKEKNINIYPYLKDSFDIMFGYRFPEAIKRIETIKRIIEVEKPDCISLIDEADSFGRCIVTAAKLKGVPVVAMQHGLIGPQPPAYMHSKGSISPKGNIKSPYCPIPNKTAVYGPYDKRILTEISSYPKDSVVVTGQPRYDILARVNEVFDREKTLEKLNLDKNKKLIVWTTQSHGLTKEENEKSFNAVYNAIKELSDDVQLVIKLHPNEFDLTLHKEIAKEVGIKPIITKDIDIYEILYACDIMLTKHSTTAIEAMILNKPVITMNFSKEADPMPYAESGAALGVYKEEDLIINIKKALYDKQTQEKLKKAREKFVYEHAYKQDGKATERVCDLIEEMIENAKKK